MSTRSRRDNQHIQSWLRVNSLLSDINDEELLRNCAQKIIPQFSHKELLFALSTSANKTQIMFMCETIKKLKLNHDHKKAITQSEELKEETNKPNETKQSYFLSLSNESIHNICTYLTKRDIFKFKFTSKQIGIICLQEQLKISVSVFNANYLINNINMNLHQFISRQTTKSRYNPNIRLYALFEEWSEKYNIPPKYQLIVQYNTINVKNNIMMADLSDLTLLDSNSIRLHSIHLYQNRNFLVFDTRKIIVMNKNKCGILENIHNIFAYLKDYKLMILEYFNVIQQKCDIAQFILYYKHITFNDIFNYIEHKFIYIDEMNYKWHQQLIHNLKQMNGNKFCIYKHVQNISQKKMNLIEKYDVIPVSPLYTFELNANELNELQSDKAKQQYEIEGFYSNSREFCVNNSISITAQYMGKLSTLKANIKHCFEEKEQKDVHKLKSIVKIMNCFDFKYNAKLITNIGKKAKSGLLRIKISDILFNNTVPANNIEIFNWDIKKRLKWNVSSTERCKFDIVSYDTKTFDINNDVLYRITIYYPNECPHPYFLGKEIRYKYYNYNLFGNGRTEPDDVIEPSFTFKYKKSFTVSTFINDILLSMKNSNDYIRWKYKNILDIFFDNDDAKINDKIPCVFAEHISQFYREKSVNAYAMDQNINTTSRMSFDKIKKFDLYILQPKQILNATKLKIKFVASWKQKFNSNTDINQIDKVNFVGMPLIVWVNRYDRLQNVIDKYVKGEINIKGTYKVRNKSCIESIPKNKRNSHSVYGYNSNDFIVITFSNTKHTNVPTYSSWVYKL